MNDCYEDFCSTSDSDTKKQISGSFVSKFNGSFLQALPICKDDLVSEDSESRAQAIEFLCGVIQQSHEIKQEEAGLIFNFLHSKLTESIAVFQILCSQLYLCQLHPSLLTMDLFASTVLLFASFQPQKIRFVAFQLFLLLLERTQIDFSSEDLRAIAKCVDGERDPRNLSLVFQIVRLLQSKNEDSAWQFLLFEMGFRYFPITFRPKPGESFSVDVPLLKSQLKEILIENAIVYDSLTEFLIEKLNSPLPGVHLDCYDILLPLIKRNSLTEDGFLKIVKFLKADSSDCDLVDACRGVVCEVLSRSLYSDCIIDQLWFVKPLVSCFSNSFDSFNFGFAFLIKKSPCPWASINALLGSAAKEMRLSVLDETFSFIREETCLGFTSNPDFYELLSNAVEFFSLDQAELILSFLTSIILPDSRCIDLLKSAICIKIFVKVPHFQLVLKYFAQIILHCQCQDVALLIANSREISDWIVQQLLSGNRNFIEYIGSCVPNCKAPYQTLCSLLNMDLIGERDFLKYFFQLESVSDFGAFPGLANLKEDGVFSDGFIRTGRLIFDRYIEIAVGNKGNSLDTPYQMIGTILKEPAIDIPLNQFDVIGRFFLSDFHLLRSLYENCNHFKVAADWLKIFSITSIDKILQHSIANSEGLVSFFGCWCSHRISEIFNFVLKSSCQMADFHEFVHFSSQSHAAQWLTRDEKYFDLYLEKLLQLYSSDCGTVSQRCDVFNALAILSDAQTRAISNDSKILITRISYLGQQDNKRLVREAASRCRNQWSFVR